MFQVEEVSVRFDELILKVPDDEIRLKFHPRLTVVSGLGPSDREAMADTIVGALTGGEEQTAFRCFDASGRAVIVLSGGGGPVRARHDDGSGAEPVGELVSSPDALRELILVRPPEPVVVARPPRDDEPAELREARAALAEIGEQLQQVLEEEQTTAAVRTELDAVDEQLRNADEIAARRTYADVLTRLERVRSEAATLHAGPARIAEDRRLLAAATTVDELVARWKQAAGGLAAAIDHLGATELLHDAELVRLAALPDQVPHHVEELARAVAQTEADIQALEQQLAGLTVGNLPEPSQPLVAELGAVDQSTLWGAADRLSAARDEVRRVQLTLGGLGEGGEGSTPVEIEALEAAHRDLEESREAAESVRVPAVAGSGLGLAVALAGAIGETLLIGLGMLIAVAVGGAGIVLPRRRIARAAALERAALGPTGAPSYLGFHLRRVEGGMDPHLRESIAAARDELRAATVAWAEVAGPDAELDAVRALAPEVQAYHETLAALGSTAEEIEQVRAELAQRAHPAARAARAELAQCCEPLGLEASDLHDAPAIVAAVTHQIDRGRAARQQIELERAEAEEGEVARELQARLETIDLGSGPLPARVAELEAAVEAAAAREADRARARPVAEVDAELSELEQQADRLRRPHWDDVALEELDGPDVPELEARRAQLRGVLAEARPRTDVSRLSDRHAALDRRVTALEAKLGASEDPGDPALAAEIREALVARLQRAAAAGPQGDPVPVLLDEVLERVPVDRKWDLLDHLYQLSEAHQLVYLSNDPFVAAWARQRTDGGVTLLEPEPEPV